MERCECYTYIHLYALQKYSDSCHVVNSIRYSPNNNKCVIYVIILVYRYDKLFSLTNDQKKRLLLSKLKLIIHKNGHTINCPHYTKATSSL